MKHLAWIGGLFALLLIVVWRLMTARAERAEAEIAALKQQMTEKISTRATVPTDVPARITLPVQHAMVAPEPAPSAQPADRRPARPAGSPAPSYEDLTAYYQTSLEAQSIDVNWSRDATRRLRGVFGQYPAAAIKSVECRQTICRAELTHDSDADARTFMEKWQYGGARLEWQGPIMGGVVGPAAGGTARSVFYLAREGTEFPRLN
jgi:hypothetical protein